VRLDDAHDRASDASMATVAVRERSNLPSEVTSFVGRRRETTQVRGLMAESRLVTVTGMGGIGKTRLARRVGSALGRVFKDGVWQVELEDLADSELLAPTIAAALGLPQQREDWTVEALAKQIGHRHMLVLLDNCEHLVEASAAVVARLLSECPRLYVLATSREVLGVGGERSCTLGPLGVPRPGHASADTVASSESVSLFVDRASHVSPDFVLDEGNAPAIAELCARLDGVPLALELAAAWVRVLTPDALVSQLADHVKLLNKGPRTYPPRQQSLQALVDWSYQLCAEDERTLWRRASVFAGGFELDSLQAVTRPGDPMTGLALIEVVDRLVAKSILFADHHTESVRFRMPEMIRAYGLDHLRDMEEDEPARRAHLAWCIGMAERARREWVSTAQLAWFKRVRREVPNIRAALDFSLSRPGGGLNALHLLDCLSDTWIALGFMTEGGHWLDRVTAADLAPEIRVTALRLRAILAAVQGDRDVVAQTLSEAWELARSASNESEIAWLTYATAFAALAAGREEARSQMQEAVRRFQAVSNINGLIWALGDSVIVEATSPDPSGTESRVEAFMAVADQVGESWERSYVEWARAFAYWRQGKTKTAKSALRESLGLSEQFGDHLGLGQGQELAAWILAQEGDPRKAAEVLGGASASFSAAGSSVDALAYLSGPHDDLVNTLVDNLGKEAFNAAYERGLIGPRDPVIFGTRDPPRKVSGVHEDVSPLTRRETEIAELVANGLTNKEIAAKLVISQRTVDTHVENIFVKLGFTSRGQVTVWVLSRRSDRSSD
jgi:predicted ATPase/DNA-binding CsgD family transcriptional regulator